MLKICRRCGEPCKKYPEILIFKNKVIGSFCEHCSDKIERELMVIASEAVTTKLEV